MSDGKTTEGEGQKDTHEEVVRTAMAQLLDLKVGPVAHARAALVLAELDRFRPGGSLSRERIDRLSALLKDWPRP